MNKVFGFGLLLGLAGASSAAPVISDTTGWIINTSTSEETGCTSLDTNGNNKVSLWTDGAFPVAGNKYLIRMARLRSPTKTSATDKMWWFAGDTLAIDGGDCALLGMESNIKFNFTDLRWYTGSLSTWTCPTVYLGGNICVGSTGSSQSFRIQGRQQFLNVHASVTSVTEKAYLNISSENNGWPKDATNSGGFGRFTARFLGDTSAFYGTVVINSSNATLQAAGSMPVAVLAKYETGEVSSCGPKGRGAAYRSVELVRGASLIVPGTNTVSVGDLTVADGASLVWQTAADGALGTLVVTNALSITKPFTIQIADATTSAVGGTADLLKVPGSLDLTTTDFVFASNGEFGDFPMVYDPEVVVDGDWKIVRVRVRTGVTQIVSDGSSYWTANLDSSLTNAANWSDGQLPHDNAIYTIPDMKILRTLEPKEAKSWPLLTFPGDLLVVESNGTFAVRSDFSVNLQLRPRSYLYTTAHNAIELSGCLALPLQANESVTFYAYTVRQQRIASEISGACQIKIAGWETSGTPGGTIALAGLNTNFLGKVQVTIKTAYKDRALKCPLPTEAGHERLRISDARNLGGALAGFTYDALQLDQWSELLTTNNVTIPADSNRGLYLCGVATLTPSAGTTLAIESPITYRGRVRKDGTGLLALGAKPRFIDGEEATEPLATTNVLEVIAGSIRADAAEALNGVAVTFSNDTQWVVSAAATGDLKTYGAINTRSELGGFTSEATDGKINVVLTDFEASAKPKIEVALCTLANKTAADALVGNLSVAKPYKGGTASTSVRTNADGTATVCVSARPTGMVLIYN